MELSVQQVKDFQATVWEYYRRSGRHDLPWRQPEADGRLDPYKIMVSELMLQQTQVKRVISKYHQFLELFPTVEALSQSSLAAVLTAWSGLGYNRRAKYLHEAAKVLVTELAGNFPENIAGLQKLPGVGKNTAGAILAYAFNQPVVFVETNIRTVFFHHFFAGRGVVSDGEVLEIAGETLDTAHPREWYWALMDYGAYLKSSGMKLNTLSKHYIKQSTFEGSKRQVRGKVIKLLALEDADFEHLHTDISDDRLPSVLDNLLHEGLITKKADRYHLSD
jgi:A/G-specific adenine glycosylase